jgi:phage shock protein PspC (stress-responsive transcriptional regulator)
MIDRGLQYIFQKYKLPSIAFISVIGLGSIFAVNVAGFVLFLPRPFWGLLDTAFVASYFTRLSLYLALAFLASRYSVYIISSILGFICWPIVLFPLITSDAGQRLIRIKGGGASLFVAAYSSRRFDWQKLDNGEVSVHKVFLKKLYNSKQFRFVAGVTYIVGRNRGGIDFHVKNYGFPIQFVVSLLTLSVLFMTFMDGFSLIALAIGLAIILPPSFGEIVSKEPSIENGSSVFSVLRIKSWKMFDLQKVTLLALTLSFASGVLHHKSLISSTNTLDFLGNTEDAHVTGNLVLSISTGFIVHSVGAGYQFVPKEGTKISLR